MFLIRPLKIFDSDSSTDDDEWEEETLAAKTADPAMHITVLEAQLSAMTERLDSLYATATDLIADSELDSVLARITKDRN